MEPIWQAHSSPAAHAIQDGPGQACLSEGRKSQPRGKEKYVRHIQQQLCSRVTRTGLFSSFLTMCCLNPFLISSHQQRPWNSLSTSNQSLLFLLCLQYTKIWKLNLLAGWHSMCCQAHLVVIQCNSLHYNSSSLSQKSLLQKSVTFSGKI